MAYGNWITPSKVSGSGNDTVNVSANSPNTGRNARSTTLTFKAANCDDVLRTVLQAGKPETSSIQASASSEKGGGTLTISGTSNSKKLTFSKGTDNIGITLPTSYTANGVSTTNGANITGDPGANAEYPFSIVLTIPANTGIANKTCQIIVTDDGGTAHTCTITLAAGDATLSVSPESLTIPWDASESKSFTVTSNTNWTIS